MCEKPLQDRDFAPAGVPQFSAVLTRRFAGWRDLPIADGGIRDAAFERSWTTAGAEARGVLRRGGKVIIHCFAGLGRTGTVAAKLLVEPEIADPHMIEAWDFAHRKLVRGAAATRCSSASVPRAINARRRCGTIGRSSRFTKPINFKRAIRACGA